MPPSIWSILHEAAQVFGERLALVEGAHRATYGELFARVSARAAQWRSLGIGRGERAAVLDWNSGAFVESYFAAAGLGAILNPLNHRLAPRELSEILEDSGARLVLASRSFAETVERLRGHFGDRIAWLWSEDPVPPAAFEPGGVVPGGADTGDTAPGDTAPGDIAQLYYTSGTTGRAKGVMLTHANVCTHAEAAVRELGLTSADRWGHFAPLFHLADAWATFALTRVGGVHVMHPRFEAAGVLACMERDGVTLTNLVPTMLRSLVEHPHAASTRLPRLRLVLSGGAPISPALVRRVLEVLRCEYVQTYGMTETSPYLTLGILREEERRLPADEALRRRARTGRPFAGVELEVVDDAGRPVPRDDESVGEIRVRGATVTHGYWNRPEETARAIRQGWLYTGDLAVIDRTGSVNIVDRRKDMILSGGENVYSTEVENALHEHPSVLEAAVFGRPDPFWGECVNAAVVLRSGHEVGARELIDFCRARIAGYKAPKGIEFLAELPRTGSGKISKQALRSRLPPELDGPKCDSL